MNNTTETPVFDAAGSNNAIGFEWGTTNPTLSVLKSIISNNEQSYHIPREYGIKTPSFKCSPLLSATTTNIAFSGGVLGLNGKIYTVPNSATTIVEFDPDNNTSRVIVTGLSSTTYKWMGGALASNGNIYCMPRNAGTILEINPYSKKHTLIGTGITVYNGTVLAPNGKIYGMPYSGVTGNILEFDPISKEYSTFGNVGTNTYYGGVVGPNGKIYAMPENNLNVLVIDVYNKTTSYISAPSSITGPQKYGGGVLTPNGKIYCVPVDATEILVIDTLTNTTYGIPTYGTSNKWNGGALAPDGHIYFMPDSANSSSGIREVLRINWLYDTLEYIKVPNNVIPGTISLALCGAIVTPSGKLIGLPQSNDYALVLDFNTPINPNICFNSVVNKF